MVKRQIQALTVTLFLLVGGSVSAAQAPNFKLPGTKSDVKLSAYRGKVVYVDFWASWCGPCRKSFPWMSELQERYGSSLKVIAVNLDQDKKEAIKFLKKTKPNFAVAFDPKGKVAEKYKVRAMPSSYLIDQRGKIVSAHTGFRSKDKQKLEKQIQKLVSKRLSSNR